MGTDPTMWVYAIVFVAFVALFAIAAHMDRGKESDVYPDYHPEDYNDVTYDLTEWDSN